MKKILLILLLCLTTQSFAQNVKLKNMLSFYSAPQPAPNFYFYDMEDNQVSLQDFDGKIVLLHVWKTTCAVCLYELPQISELERRIADPDFKVVIIHSGEETAFDVKKFLAGRKLILTNSYIDKNGRFSKVIKSSMLPVSFIIDGEGRELAREYGGIDWTSPVIRKQIANLIINHKETEKDNENHIF